MTTFWQCKLFSQLTIDELYDALKLRVDVFVVEQQCYYPELDNKDRDGHTWHLFHYQQQDMLAYLRLLPPGLEYPDYVAIGRVVIAESARGTGLGHELLREALKVCQQKWPDVPIKISAQQHLEQFYQRHGFTTVSEMYLEDNIPHIAMLRQPE